jgi:hypothetical protein
MALFYTPALPPSQQALLQTGPAYLYMQLQQMAVLINDMNTNNNRWRRVRAKDFYLASIR